MKIVANNKKAHFNYEILETFEAGIVLTGAEIKAVRAGKVNIEGAHARILQIADSRKQKANNKTNSHKLPFGLAHGGQAINHELYLINAHIASLDKTDATKSRKILMHKQEINSLLGKTSQKKLVIIPLNLHFKRGWLKVTLALGRGKKLHDKRESIKKKDIERERQKEI